MQRSVTIAEEKDEDDLRMKDIPKLDESSPHIMESTDDKDDQILVDRPTCSKEKMTGQSSRKYKEKEIPINKGGRYKRSTIPSLNEELNPTPHSDTMKYRMTQQQEVALAVMEANLEVLSKEEEVLPSLRSKWVEHASDILSGAPSGLPPLREVNHKIPLIDDNKRHKHYLPRCPDSLKSQLINKIQLYTSNGWWEETNVSQAAPMLCVLKKSGRLRMVIDGHKQNENIEKDVTPFLDQEQIRNDVARGKYQSKINMLNAYEQIHIEPSDVWKTVFTTVYGTFMSHRGL